MALYTSLVDSNDGPLKGESIAPAPSTEEPPKGKENCDKQKSWHGEENCDKQKRWHGTLYGFKPTLLYVMGVLTSLIALNIHWCQTGYMGFERVSQFIAVQPSHWLPGPGWLLASRIVCLIAVVVPLSLAVRGYRKMKLKSGEKLVLGGLEILLVFCTLWTWCCKAGYFLASSTASFLFVVFGLAPGPVITDMLWVWFDIAFGMSWLVFWACWIILIPAAWLANRRDAVKEMLSAKVLYLHNVNVILVVAELMLSSWTIRLTHCIFPIYFAIAYVFFNWWLHSKINRWIYFFLDYDRPTFVLFCLGLVALIIGCFWFGSLLAMAIGKA